MPINRRHFWLGLPFIAAGAGGIGFYKILGRMQAGTYNPHALPSPLIGKHPPAFSLPGIAGLQGFSNTDFSGLQQPVLINWFASWCSPCQQEALVLHDLAKSGVTIWGIAYEDNALALANYLQKFGNPYQRLAADKSGLTAINWGVYGVPETYFVDKTGIIRLRYAGPLSNEIVQHVLAPMIRQYS